MNLNLSLLFIMVAFLTSIRFTFIDLWYTFMEHRTVVKMNCENIQLFFVNEGTNYEFIFLTIYSL